MWQPQQDTGCDSVPTAEPPWPELLPLDAEPTLPSFPLAALGADLADFVAAVSESLQVPADLPASMALASLSVCCGGRWRVAPRVGWAEPVNLYVVCALPPSERKSSVLSALSGPFADWERSRAEAFKPLVREAKAAQAVPESGLPKS